MKILVTRPDVDAAPVSRALEERGAQVITEPLLTIEPRPAALPDLDDAQALLFTSANGVRAFAARSARRDLPVHAVGDATAEAAREAGFGDVASAAGDVAALAAAVIADCRPDAGPLLQVAGTVSAGDLAGELTRAGFTVERVVLYEAVPATVLSDALIAALSGGEIAGALFFSPRTAQLFLDLVDHAAAKASLQTVTAYALSPAVAEVLAAGAFHRVVTAAAPTLAALLAVVDHEPPVPEATAVDEPVPVVTPVIDLAAPEPAAPEPTALEPTAPEPVAPEPVVPEPPVMDPPPRAFDRSGVDPAPVLKPEPSVVPPRQGRPVVWLAVLLLLVIVGVGASPWWAPTIAPLLPWGAVPPSAGGAPDSGALAGRVTSLEGAVGPMTARLDALDRKVAAVPSRPDQPASAPSRPEQAAVDLSGPVAALAARLAKLEQTTASLATIPGRLDTLDGRVQPLEQRLSGVEQAVKTEDPRLAALALRVDALGVQFDTVQKSLVAAARVRLVEAVVPAATAIRAAVETGQPFAGPLAIVARDRALPPLATAAAAIDPALAVLTPAATRGVEPLAPLRASFPAAAASIRTAAQAATPAAAKTGWWVDARAALGSVIQVTHIDPDAPGADGPIARAGEALAHDDLRTAAAALHGLTGPAATAAAPWLQRADARLAAVTAADALVAAVGRITLDAPSAAAPAP